MIASFVHKIVARIFIAFQKGLKKIKPNIVWKVQPGVGGWGEGGTIYFWVRRCGAAPHTLTPFKTKIADFSSYPVEDRILIFDTLFKTYNPKDLVNILL